MIHITFLGSFGQSLNRYADRSGSLPQSEEELLHMDYELCVEELMFPDWYTALTEEQLKEADELEADELLGKPWYSALTSEQREELECGVTGVWDKGLREDFWAEASAAINEATDKLEEWQRTDKAPA